MVLETNAHKRKTTLYIDKKILLESSENNIEKAKLPINSVEQQSKSSGTKITLKKYPSIPKLRKELFENYGRANDFNIIINDTSISIEDLGEDVIVESVRLDNGKSVTLKCAVLEKNIKHSGIAIKVNGKQVGKEQIFDLDKDEEVPNKLVKRIYAEIHADILSDDLTADGGSILENSETLKNIKSKVKPIIKNKLNNVYQKHFALQKARLQKQKNYDLSRLPEYKRDFAQKAIDKILHRFYGEKEERIDTIISIVLDALEKDEYFTILENIEQLDNSDISLLAEKLSDFGFLEMAKISEQAKNRNRILNKIEDLVNNPRVLEQDIHKALEQNLWIFGVEYSIMSSNESLKNIIKKFFNSEFKDSSKKTRPDLLLSRTFGDRYLLIEFKKSSVTISHDEENQAIKYKDQIIPYIGNASLIDVIVIGGKVDIKVQNPRAKLITYNSLISNARLQIEWLLKDI
jgi:hypothetical protein